MGKLEGLPQVRQESPVDGERRERLEYLADLLRELQALARQEGCSRLPDLIEHSRAEAIAESLRDVAHT